MRARSGLVACVGVVLFTVSACGGSERAAPPDARALGTLLDGPAPVNMGETPDAGAAGGADAGAPAPLPGAAQARPTSNVTSPS